MSKKPSDRPLGLWSATAAVMATMIGAGIFGTSGAFAHDLGSDTSVLLVWLFSGLLALTGALSLGELSAMMPKNGGCYTYNRYLYGNTAGYLSGVLSWLLGFVGATAFITLLLGVHVTKVVPGLPPLAPAITVVLLFTLVHCYGLREGNGVNNFFTVFKVGVILAFIVGGFLVDAPAAVVTQPATSGLFSAVFASSMLKAGFAYLGWETSTWIAGDISNPKRNLPRSLIIGTILVTVLYLLLNAVFLRAQSAASMTGEIPDIGLHSAKLLFSPAASSWFNWMIIVVLLSTTSTIIMVGARILQSMAANGQLPSSLGQLSPTHVPKNALLLQAVFTVGFIVAIDQVSRVGAVLDYLILLLTFIMAATVTGVLVLRRREPDSERPFRVPLYPFTPLLFLGLSAWMIISTMINDKKAALASAITLLVVWLLKPILCATQPQKEN